MKTYALMREQDRIRPGDADTGEMHPKSPVPGPVPQHAPSANSAVQLRDAVRARRQELEILRSATDAAEAAKSRAEEPLTTMPRAGTPAAERIEPAAPALPVPDIEHMSLPELLLLRPVIQAPLPEPALEPEASEGTEESPPMAAEPTETPPETEALEARTPKPVQEPEEKEPTADKIQAPRSAQVLGQVTTGSSPRIPGPLVFEVAPPEPAGERFRPTDTPPDDGAVPPEETKPAAVSLSAQPSAPLPVKEEPETALEEEKPPQPKTAERPQTLEEPAAPEAKPEQEPEEKEAAEEPEKETDEEATADKAERKAGVDPDAPADEPLDRDAVEDLEIGEDEAEPAPGGPAGGGGGAAPALDAWKARATQAAVDIEKPDLGPPAERTKGMAEHGKKAAAGGQKRRKELPKEAKPVLVAKKRDISELGKVPDLLRDDPVGAAKSIQAAARGKELVAQRLPLLRPTPQNYLPNLYGDSISPADFKALKETYAKELAAAKAKKGKEFDEMAALLDAFKKDLNRDPKLEGRIAVFEGQKISGAELPPKLEVAPAHQADIAAVLARIVTESEKIPDAWIKRARDLAYANKALSRPHIFPDIGADWTPKEAELLRAEIQRVRDAAGISKEQLDKAIEDRQEQLKKDKGASLKEGDKVYKEVKGKMEADYELTLGSIEGIRQEWEDWADERAARDSKVDWEAIRERQRAMEKAVRDMAADWIVGYDDMRKARLQKLQMAAGKQKKAYEAALAKDKELLLQKDGADEKKIDKTNKAFLDARMKEIGTRIGKLDKDNRKTVAEWQKDMRTEREHALERLQKWGDKQIKRERTWFDKIIARVFRWRDEQKSEARAFAKQRAGETVADMGTHLQALNQVHLQFGDDLDEDEKAKLKTMSKEQRALVEKYYASGKDAIGLVAERLKIRLRNQRVPKIKQAMVKQVMAIHNNSTRGLKVAHLAKALNESPFGAASKAHSGFEHTWGTHEERVYAAMRMVSSPVGAKGLRAVYFDTYREDFDTRLKSELAGGWPDKSENYDKARSILEQDKVGEAAADLRDAVEGAGTTEAKINEALRRFPPGPERKKVLEEYERKYGEKLEDRLKSELSGLEEDVSIALVKNKDARADAIEVRQAQFAVTTSGSREDMEKVYARIRKEEYERARAESSENLRHEKKPVSAAQIEARIKARQLALGNEYKTAFKVDFEKSVRHTFQFEPQAADLVIGLQNQDFKAVDAARLEIERRGLYAADDTINDKVLKIQHQRAYERHKYDAEIQLQKEESDYLKKHPGSGPMLAADRLKRKEQLLKQASDKARADASKSMAELKGFYMRKYGQHYPKYMGGGSTDPASFDKIIKGLTQGKGEDEAVERLKGSGYLVPHRELYYAVKNGDKDAIKALLNGKSLDEITAIQEKYQNDPSIKPKPDFKKDVLGQLSGRDRNDMKIQLEHGEPTDPATALKIAEAKLAYERRTGGVRGGVKRERFRELELLVDRLREDKERYEAARADPTMKKTLRDEKTGVRYFANPAMGAYQNSWQAGIRSVNEIVDVHRQEVDAETELVANLLAMTAAVVVGALLAPFTAGASLGLILLIAGAIALASTAATMATKYALKGDAYSADEMTMDLAFGVVDFVVTAVTLGAGKFVAPMLKGTMAAAQTGKTTVKQAFKQIGKGVWTKGAKRAAVNQAQTEAAQGLFATFAVPAFMDEYGKGLNPLASTLLTLGLTMGSGIAVGKGVQRMQRARPADFDFSAHAKTKGKGKGSDLIELRGDPRKLKSMQEAYLKDNPHRTAKDFLKDYDDILLKMMKDQDFKAKWQKSARKELLQDISDPKLKQQLTETPVDLISDKEFLRLTGSKKGYAVVIIKDGVPTVVLRQGAPASALRQEGQHLLQAVQKKWKGHMEMLDETKLRDWKVKDAREKLVAYDAKLDLEVDANEQYLLILRNQAKGADVPPQLADQIAGMELMLRNLYKRKLEVANIGPLRRTLMGWGSIFEPQYLRQRPRLFGKHPGPKMKLSDSEVLENIELPKPWNYPAKYFPFKPRTGPPSELAAQLRLLNAELAAKGEKVRIVPHPAKGDDAATFARIVSASDPEAPPPFIFLRDATDPPAGKNALSRFRLERNPGGLPPAPEGHYYFRDANGDYSLKKIGDPSLPGKRLVPVEDADDLARGLTHRVEDVGVTRWEPATHKGADTGADWDAFMLGSYRPRSWDPNLPPRRVSRSYEDFRGFVADLVQGQARNHPTNPRTLTKVEIDAEIHRNLDEVLAGMSGQKTVDKVRHAFKQRYGAKIDDWIQDGLEVLADPSASRTAKSAAVAESLERLKRFTTSPVNVKDQGNVAERWYQAMRRKQGRQLHHEPVLTKGEKSTASPDYEGRKPDFADLEDKALVDVKSHKDSLSGDDIERLNAYLTAVSDEGGAHLTHRTLEGVQVGFDKVRVVFTNLEGARASTKKLQTLLPDRNFSFEVFDARGVPHRLDWKGLQALKKRLNAKSLAEIYERGWPNIDLDATPPRVTPQPPPGKTPATPETGRAPRTGEGGGERPPPAGEDEATPRHPREAAGPEGSPEPELGRTPDGTHEVGVDAKGPFRCSDSCRLVQDTYAKELGERPDLAQRLAGLEASSSTGGDKAIRDEAARLVQALEDQRTLSRLGRKELASEIARTPSGTPRADKLHYELHRRDTLGKGRIPQSYRDWLSFRPPPGNPYASLARLGLDDLELGTLRANEIPAEVAETLLSRGMKASQLARTADSGGPTALRAIDRISAHPDFDMARARSLAAQAQAEGGLRALDETTPDTLARLLSRGATEPDLMRILGKHGAVGLRIVDGLTARSLAGESLTLREAERIARLATGIAALPALYKGIGLNLDPRLAHVPELTATLAQSRRLLNPRVLSKLLKKIGQEAEEIHGLTKRPATKYGTLQQVEDAATRATRGPGRRITMETWSDPARTTPRPYEADVMEHRSGGGTTVQHKEVSGGMDAVKSNVLGAVEQLRGAKGKGKTPEVPPPGYTGIADVRVRDPRFGGDPTAWEATRQQLLAKLRENLDLVSLANTKVKHPYHPDLPESLMWKEIRITNKHGTHIFTPKDLTDPPPSP